MGSGYMMMSAVMDAMKTLKGEEVKETLESLGLDYLIDLFGDRTHEDFETTHKQGAELAAKAVRRSFEQKFGKDYPFSVDVVKEGSIFKITFFK